MKISSERLKTKLVSKGRGRGDPWSGGAQGYGTRGEKISSEKVVLKEGWSFFSSVVLCIMVRTAAENDPSSIHCVTDRVDCRQLTLQFLRLRTHCMVTLAGSVLRFVNS